MKSAFFQSIYRDTKITAQRCAGEPATGNRFYRLKHIELRQTSPSCLGGGQERIEALARDQAAVCDIGVTRFPQLSQHLWPFRQSSYILSHGSPQIQQAAPKSLSLAPGGQQ